MLCGYLSGNRVCATSWSSDKASMGAGLQSSPWSLRDAELLLMAWWQAGGEVGRCANMIEENKSQVFNWELLEAVGESYKFLPSALHSLTGKECLVYKSSKGQI